MSQIDKDYSLREQWALEGNKLLDKFFELGLTQEISIKCALIVCDEISQRLPNINQAPPVYRIEDIHYMQFWKFGVPSYLNALI